MDITISTTRAALAMAEAPACGTFEVVLPDTCAMPFFARIGILAIVADAVRAARGLADLSALAARIEAVLDGGILGASITAPIRDGTTPEGLLDLSGFDFDRLAAMFENQPDAVRRHQPGGGAPRPRKADRRRTHHFRHAHPAQTQADEGGGVGSEGRRP